MNLKGKRVLLSIGVLGSILAGAMPAFAQSHGGGGHAGGGGHMGGGGHAAAVGGRGAAPHFAAGAHYAGVGRSYGGAVGATAHYGGQARPAYGYPGGHYGGGYGYGYGHGYSTGAYWRGGYWNGGYWPRAYYGLGFSWFLPVLPLAYATYWWGGVPYYYANDVYYTYDPNYQGYVATDPPPAADPSGSAATSSDPSGASAPQDAAQAGPNGPSGPNGPLDGAPPQIFMYPKNGQSAEQTAADRAACQQWATQQAGSVAQNGANYNRAMVACVEGRGYSAR
jgi:hypothetical protein